MDRAARIRAVHRESDGTYGAPRITAELREASGEAVNHKRVARIVRASGTEGSGCAGGTARPSPIRLRSGRRTWAAGTSPPRRHHLPAP
ncbi:transposase [Streptomyces sp. NPDC048567]|uniref:transposase n=1 Tax=Streptomyces sp. NPDC048567 TaxID=3365570 RepID=UPI003718FA2D